MNAKDLKSPFSWENRRPLIEENVFFLPDYLTNYDEFVFPELRTLFSRPVFLEYCSGNGQWICQKAKSYGNVNWVAVEMRFDRVRKIWAKGKNLGLSNLFVVCGNGVTFTEHYLLDRQVDEIFINFPDPWPKNRHAKHRLMQPSFINQMGRILKPNGKVTFVTDDVAYLEETLSLFLQHPSFQPVFPLPHFVHELPEYGDSYFDALWREKGRKIHYLQMVKP